MKMSSSMEVRELFNESESSSMKVREFFSVAGRKLIENQRLTNMNITGSHRDVILQTNIRISSISLIYKTNEKALNEVNAEGKL
uniref:Uncharacterized protein n=1 Tax=Arion vulgaris TaxID=1028688 RepID=A0A0B7AKI7_9EUPU